MPELGCHALIASTAPEASAFGVSLVGMLTSVTSDSLMPADSSAFSSSRWLTKPTSTPIFLPLRSVELRGLRPADHHVVAVRVVVDQDGGGRLAGLRAQHERVAVRHRAAVRLARGERVHARDVVHPHELEVETGLLVPLLLAGDLPGDPARPVAVDDLQRLGGARLRRDGAEREEEAAARTLRMARLGHDVGSPGFVGCDGARPYRPPAAGACAAPRANGRAAAQESGSADCGDERGGRAR